MTQPPNRPYNPNQPYNQGQGYDPSQGQGYNPTQGQGYNPSQGQGYNPTQGQGYNPNQPYDPAQAQQQAAQQQYEAQQGVPKKRFGARKIISFVITIAVLGFGAWSLWQNFAQNQALTTGKCLTIKVTSDKDNSVEPKEVDCSDKSQYSWEVAQVTTAQSLCPADTEYAIELTRSSRRSGKTTTEKVACLIPNLHQDVCYAKQQGNDEEPLKVADCSTADIKVTKRTENTSESCGENEKPHTINTPARTYCLAPAK
ncbi:LppU/SCO3897 family protein [Arachnia propionica]